MVTKICKNFFLQNYFFDQNLLFNFMLKYFFQKIEISNFLKTSTTPRGMNGLDGLRGP